MMLPDWFWAVGGLAIGALPGVIALWWLTSADAEPDEAIKPGTRAGSGGLPPGGV